MNTYQKVEVLLESLAEKQAMQTIVRMDKDRARDSVLTAEIRQALADIDVEFAGKEEAASEGISDLESVIKAETIGIGETVKGDKLYAVFNKPRITWDAKGLTGYAVAHPEVAAFRKTGTPSVSIRMTPRK